MFHHLYIFTEFNDGVSVAFLMLAEVCTLRFHLICSSKSDSNGLTGTQTRGKDTFPGLHGLCDSELQPEHLESTAIVYLPSRLMATSS